MGFVGFVAALGGGILLGLVIGAVPPLAFSDWRYVVTAVRRRSPRRTGSTWPARSRWRSPRP